MQEIVSEIHKKFGSEIVKNLDKIIKKLHKII